MATKRATKLAKDTGAGGSSIAPSSSSLTDRIVARFLDRLAGDEAVPREVVEKLRLALAAATPRAADLDRAFEAVPEDLE